LVRAAGARVCVILSEAKDLLLRCTYVTTADPSSLAPRDDTIVTDDAGGRVFFSSVGRTLEREDEIHLASVGVDIGSSTSHLVFSRLTLERLDSRYVVASREIVYESDVLLTPYTDARTIDPTALGRFVDRQYALAGISPDAIDTGALILTGVAAARRNARAIGELFAAQAGRFVAVSAGDALETTLAAHGSGALARSIRDCVRVMNVDIGGGTTKIAVCENGAIVEMTVLDVGARLIAFDAHGRIDRVEDAGHRFATELGVSLESGGSLDQRTVTRIAARMAYRLFEAISEPAPSAATAALLRLPALANSKPPDVITFSGGVSEYLYGRADASFGDLGPALAAAILELVGAWGPRIERSEQGLRATVVGASQYTVQVSGSTIFVEPHDALPVRNVPVVVPDLPLDADTLDPTRIADAVRNALAPLELDTNARAVALGYRFAGAATYARLDAFCRGVTAGLAAALERDSPLILIGDGDLGGLVGLHLRNDVKLANPVVSIDGIALAPFDYVDIGALLAGSGAVPVVVKSLVFPGG